MANYYLHKFNFGITQYYGNFSSDGASTGVGAGSSDTTANVLVPVSRVWRGKKTDTDTGTGSGITSPLIHVHRAETYSISGQNFWETWPTKASLC